MNQQLLKQLEDVYNAHSEYSLAMDVAYMEVVDATTEEVDRRYNMIREHVTEVYNCEAFRFTFEDKRSTRITKPNFYMMAKFGTIVDELEAHIYSYAPDNQLFHIFAVLHEIGHGIDLKMRPSDFQMKTQPMREEIKKEVLAWIYGLRFGLLLGFISKEETDKYFIRCMACLGTYYKYHKQPTEKFIIACKKVYQEISK